MPRGPERDEAASANARTGPEPDPESAARPQGIATDKAASAHREPPKWRSRASPSPTAATPAPKHWAEMVSEMTLP